MSPRFPSRFRLSTQEGRRATPSSSACSACRVPIALPSSLWARPGGIVRPLVAATIAAFVSACGSTAPDGSASQVAPRYTLTIALGGSGSGNVRSTDGAIDCPASRCAATTQAGTRYTLVAAAAPGSHFSGWGNACSASVACEVLLSGDQTVSASFDKDRSTGTTHELRISVNGAGTVTSQPGGIDCARSCAASFDAAATVALTAVPTSGFIFAGWGGACSGAGPLCGVDGRRPAGVGHGPGNASPGRVRPSAFFAPRPRPRPPRDR